MTSPIENSPRPAGHRADEPAPVDEAAGDDDPEHAGEEERREDPAVEVEVAELERDLGHHLGDGERLERDERDRHDQAGGERPPARGEQAADTLEVEGRLLARTLERDLAA